MDAFCVSISTWKRAGNVLGVCCIISTISYRQVKVMEASISQNDKLFLWTFTALFQKIYLTHSALHENSSRWKRSKLTFQKRWNWLSLHSYRLESLHLPAARCQFWFKDLTKYILKIIFLSFKNHIEYPSKKKENCKLSY